MFFPWRLFQYFWKKFSSNKVFTNNAFNCLCFAGAKFGVVGSLGNPGLEKEEPNVDLQSQQSSRMGATKKREKEGKAVPGRRGRE